MGGTVVPVPLWLQDGAALLLLKAWRTLLQAAVLLCVLVLELWVAVFFYGSFYYYYMPSPSFTTSAHFLFRADCASTSSSFCSFPTANISLQMDGIDQVMIYGQPYRISMLLEMPESPANQELGMFMVRMSCYTKEGQTVSSVARSAMLHYRSGLLQTLSTLTFSPLLLFGLVEEKQMLEVEMYSDYRENLYQPTVGVVVEIRSNRIQLYSAQLRIHSHYTGIRYFLYAFPLTSAVLGVASNFAFLNVIMLFSYLKVIWGGVWPPEQVRVRVLMGDATRLQQRKEEVRKRIGSSGALSKMSETGVATVDQRGGVLESANGRGEPESLGTEASSNELTSSAEMSTERRQKETADVGEDPSGSAAEILARYRE